MRAGGNQIIPRPAAVWVRPNNPFRSLDHSVLRSTEQLIARIEYAAGNVSEVDVPQGAKASAVLAVENGHKYSGGFGALGYIHFRNFACCAFDARD